MNPKLDLAMLLEERTKSNWERRKRRLELIPLEGVAVAIERARKGLPLTLEQYVVANLGFLPGELPSTRAGTNHIPTEQ